MINVKPIGRKTIDAWSIAESGLPRRIVNGSAKAGFKTVGEWRRLSDGDRKALRGIGVESIRQTHLFFETCGRIESGRQTFPSIQSILQRFLKPPEYDTLVQRYGLLTDAVVPRDNATTLDTIGRAYGICRERIRQMEEQGLASLNSTLARTCLGESHALFETTLADAHGIMLAEDVAELRGHPMTGTYNPASLFLLLCDCGGKATYRNGLFTTFPLSRIREAERAAVRFLRQSRTPQPLSDMLADVPLPTDDMRPATREYVLRCLLTHCPMISSTTDDRYFLPVPGTVFIVEEVMKRLPSPTHFRAVIGEFNALMHPGSRKGPGYILDILLGQSRFRKTASGYYELVD